MNTFKPAESVQIAKPASSILLLREKENRMEVFMVVRHHQIDVASGALVFPGGKVDANDYSDELRPYIDDPSLSDEDLGFRVAAIREAFEETGVLFATYQNEKQLVTSEKLKQLEHYREKLVDGSISLSTMLAKEELTLGTQLLHNYSHWITPEIAPKRFDTHFYVAKAPDDQLAMHDGYESVESVWIEAKQVLEEAKDGKWKIVFPTRMNIEMLSTFENFSALKSKLDTTQVVTVLPEFITENGKQYLCVPEEAGYLISKIPIEQVM